MTSQVDTRPDAPFTAPDNSALQQHFQDTHARVASSFSDYIEAGFQQSVTGLVGRRKAPDVALTADSPWYGRFMSSVAGLAGDAPAMVPGFMGGSAVGTVVGGAAGSVVPVLGTAAGAAGGAVVGGFAGAAALPAALRSAMMQAYTKGEVKSAADFVDRALETAWETSKAALVGGATGGAGIAAKAVLPVAAGALTRVAVPTAAQVTTMATVSKALEGQLPEPADFLDAAVLLFGTQAAGYGAGKLRTIYAKTGKTPAEVVADAARDPSIRDDLLGTETKGPAAPAEPSSPPGEAGTPRPAAMQATVELYRGTKSGDAGNFYSPDQSVAEMYAGKDGLVSKETVTFGNLLSSENWMEAKEKLGLPKSATMPELISTAEAKGYDGLTFKTTNGIEYVKLSPSRPELPAAYEQLALEETARSIVPGDKASAFAESPFAEIPQAKGEPAKPTHVNYNYLNTSEDAKSALARLSEIYTDEIQKQRRGTVSWEETSNEVAKMLSDTLGGVDTKLLMPREPGTPAGAAELMARKQLTIGAAEAMMGARDELLTKGAQATQADKLAFLAAVERTAMIQSEFLGARAEVGRALNILKDTKWEARRAKQIQDVVDAFNEGREPPPVFNEKAPFSNNTIFTLEKVEAARALLKSKLGTLHSGIDPEVLHAGLTIAGAYIEAGLRNFASFSKAMVEDLGDGIKPHLRELYDTAIKDDVKRAAAKAGNKNVEEVLQMHGDPMQLAEMMKSIDNPAGALKFAREAVKATTWEKVIEAWKAGILSGPVTHLSNIIGNTTFAVLRAPIDAVASGIGLLRGGADRVAPAEPLAGIFGALQGTADGLRLAGAILKTGEQPGKAEQFRKAIGGTKGEVIRLPFRFLSAEDAVFSTMNERGAAYSLAARQASAEGLNPMTREYRERVVKIVQEPTAERAAEVKAAGERFTFNTALGEKGQAVQKFVRAWHLEWAVPFIRTPANIFEELFRMTPLAPLMKEWRADYKAGGAARDKALAEVAVGTGIMSAVFMHAMNGGITGAGDPDPGKRRVQSAAGWQPYSLKVGDTYYNYQRLQPLGTLVGMAADVAEVWDHMTEEEMDKVPKMLSVAFANSVTNQTFLQGITNIVNAMSDPGRFGPKLAQQYAGSVVPAIVAQPTQMLDPVVREVNSITDAVKARIPGLREGLLPKRDVFGEPQQTKERLGAVSPVTETQETSDKVRSEAARLGVSAADAPKKVHLGRGSGKIGDVELTPEQRDKYAEVGGKLAHDVLLQMVNADGWDDLPDLLKKRAYQKVFKQAHRAAAAQALPADLREGLINTITEKVQAELAPE